LDSGILDYLTVYTRQPTTGTNVNNLLQLTELLQQKFGSERVNQILARLTAGNGPPPGNVLEFYIRSGMTAEEFAKVEGYLKGTNAVGLVNVNTASEAALACIPGIGTDKASTMVAYRQSNPDKLNTLAWVADVLDGQSALTSGPWITGRTYQFTADVAALGHHGRGYQRVKFVFDTTEGAPKILYRQDLSHLGWALGTSVRRTLLLAKDSR
jgi:hypothetical protein